MDKLRFTEPRLTLAMPCALIAILCLPTGLAASPNLPVGPVAALGGCKEVRGNGDLSEVMKLEARMWRAWAARDRATIIKLSDPSYINVDETSVATLTDVLSSFGQFHLDDYQLGPMCPSRLNADAIVLNYNARIHGRVDTKSGPVDVSRPVTETSIWVRRAGDWRNLMLHEVTLAPVRFPFARPPKGSAADAK
jgi:hypothetical protein